MVVMSSFPRSPRLLKGAIARIDTAGSMPKFIMFQYNPDTISRTLTPKYNTSNDSNVENFRLGGVPDEEITVSIEFDATDHLEHPEVNPVTALLGVNPQLSALETLVYPASEQVISNTTLAESGTMEIAAASCPVTLFVFGVSKILPVKIKSYTIEEQAYDTKLNPILAKVTLKMSVLTYSSLQQSQLAYSLYQVNHVGKEVMAMWAQFESVTSFARKV